MQIKNLKTRMIALIILVAGFLVLTVLTLSGSIAGFESNVYKTFEGFIDPTLTSVMIVITNMGSSAAVIIITLLLLAMPFTRKTFGGPTVITTVTSAVTNTILKIIIARDRPDILRLVMETGYGFPSGHAMNNAALYTMIILIVFRMTKNKKIRIPVMICGTAISFFIGVSRIYLGVHNAGDVLAGWVMGIVAALITDTVYEARLKNFLFRQAGG